MSTDDLPEDLSTNTTGPSGTISVPVDCIVNGDADTDNREYNTQQSDSKSSKISFGDDATDVTIILDDTEKLFCCHKSILTEHSLYFQAMFTSGMKESQSGQIHLQGISSEYFHSLLDYFYSGALDLCEVNVRGMAEVSSHFQVSHVLNQCCELLLSMIDDELCLSLMRLANFLTLPDVYNNSRRHALWYFLQVAQTDDFLQAPVAQVIDYLQDLHLNTESEVQVFSAAAKWLSCQGAAYDVTDTADFFSKTVSFHLMTSEEIAILKDLSVVKDNARIEAFAASLNQKEILSGFLTKDPARRRESPAKGKIVCVGSHQCALSGCQGPCSYVLHQTAPLEVLTFQPEGCYLEPMTTMSEHYPSLALDSGYRVCAIGPLVYVVGGEAQLGRTGGWLSIVWCLDTLHSRWHQAGTLPSVRRHHGLCAFDNTLFVMGGIGRYRIRLQTVESFNTKKNIWKQLPPMLYHETSPVVTQHKGSIYVFKNYAQVFNIATSSWTFLELYPPVPGLPISAYPSPVSHAIFVSCFNSESLWLVDLDRLQSQKVVDFNKVGSGGVLCRKRFYHFQLHDADLAGGTQVESYNTEETTSSVVGVLAGVVLTSNFVMVPDFPCYIPSSSNQLY